MSHFNIVTLPLIAEGDICFVKTAQIVNAINKNSDFEILEFRQFGDSKIAEVIVIECTCDDIPDKNPHGFEYREQFGIAVFDDKKDIPQVWPLREGFPTVLHMMMPEYPSLPAYLCLYFEPNSVVLRTWTAENFLRRIQWWLSKSATDELHIADQPVEQFFFQSSNSLVLPANLDELFDANNTIGLYKYVKRAKGGTYFIGDSKAKEAVPAKLLFLNLPPVVQDNIEPQERTLKELVTTFNRRGVDLIEEIKTQLKSMQTSKGLVVPKEKRVTILLLSIKIKRGKTEKVERTQFRAYIIDKDPCVFGELIGAFFKHEGRYFSDNCIIVGNSPKLSKFDNLFIEPLEVTPKNNQADYRRQSAIDEQGPNGVLIGVGAIGSVLFDLWNRAGWGKWKLIDKDQLKPHNLTRHSLGEFWIGQDKAIAVAQFGLFNTGIKHEGIVTNGLNIDSDPMQATFDRSDFVIDASTTLEYPRLVSFNESLPRHCSVFITPSGNSAILLAEDESRNIKLRTLEAQYYRAVLNNEWGEEHLHGNNGTFWSGASCRDISLKLAFSSITAHSAILAEQIRYVNHSKNAHIKIWEKKNTGEVTYYPITAYNEIEISCNNWQVFLDEGLKLKLEEIRQAQLPNETGGIILGYHDLTHYAIFIVDVLPAPIDSEGTSTSFTRGIEGMATAITVASKKTANVVNYLGEWHSHPRGCSANPSQQDLIQLSGLSSLLSLDGLPALSLIIGENDLNIIIGQCSND